MCEIRHIFDNLLCTREPGGRAPSAVLQAVDVRKRNRAYVLVPPPKSRSGCANRPGRLAASWRRSSQTGSAFGRRAPSGKTGKTRCFTKKIHSRYVALLRQVTARFRFFIMRPTRWQFDFLPAMGFRRSKLTTQLVDNYVARQTATSATGRIRTFRTAAEFHVIDGEERLTLRLGTDSRPVLRVCAHGRLSGVVSRQGSDGNRDRSGDFI
ncbi:MAG TPA: hypothetical protein VFY03_00925 [Woeseiaceae bacterium]|nr:hypothetical protein [Woeseiaceae bacterium]